MTTAAPPSPEAATRDGAQAASADFAEKVREAEAAIRAYVGERPGRQWTLRELREATTEGRSSSVMTTALFNMDDRGELVVDYVASTVTANV
ncbi:MAG: hypothetical protein JST08_04980 [Actinobacteria bacterium]|nr:hypothetical protein [Actinomycetota bacterium]